MRLLPDLPSNSRYSILVEPMWAVFGGMILFYAPLYMKGIGLSDIEIGLVNAANLFASFIFHFFASPITNKLGRKRTSLIFDLISWSIPMFIWAISCNFWYFLAAYVINASVKVVSVSWYCLTIEDAQDSQRPKIFGILNLINYSTGIFTPVTGLFIARFGTVSTLRVMYIIGMISMTLMFILRNHLVTETKAGMELMKHHSEMSLLQGMKKYIITIRNAFRNRIFILMSVIYILTVFIFNMNFFQVVYLKEHLKFSEGSLSLIPGINAVVSVILFTLVLPRLSSLRNERILSIALLISCIGYSLFLAIPERSITILLATIAVIAVGDFTMKTFRESVFMNHAGEHEKADLFSAVQTLTTFVCIPSGYISGYLYSMNQQSPFIVILCLFILALLFSLLLNVEMGRQPKRS